MPLPTAGPSATTSIASPASNVPSTPTIPTGNSDVPPSQGAVVVDAGAARALRDGGTSLLPVGIGGVEGAFEAGDAIEVVADGGAVGKGISNYSAAELRRVMGLKSGAVREVLPRATEEAVHRDYFVLV